MASKGLKACASRLCGVLLHIFNCSWVERVTLLWKTSCLGPVAKNERLSTVNGCRLITLTLHIMKSSEKLIFPSNAISGPSAVCLLDKGWCGWCYYVLNPLNLSPLEGNPTVLIEWCYLSNSPCWNPSWCSMHGCFSSVLRHWLPHWIAAMFYKTVVSCAIFYAVEQQDSGTGWNSVFWVGTWVLRRRCQKDPAQSTRHHGQCGIERKWCCAIATDHAVLLVLHLQLNYEMRCSLCIAVFSDNLRYNAQ